MSKHENKDILQVIKDEKTALYSALGVVLLVQAPHLAKVFAGLTEFTPIFGYLHGTAFAVSLDLGILFFAIRGRVMQTTVFMVCSALVTVKYYIDL
jgi:hypothetical protein